jgi:hypothetical protein
MVNLLVFSGMQILFSQIGAREIKYRFTTSDFPNPNPLPYILHFLFATKWFVFTTSALLHNPLKVAQI